MCAAASHPSLCLFPLSALPTHGPPRVLPRLTRAQIFVWTVEKFGCVNADQCVLATLMDANFLGYDTILVEDCSATTSPGYCMQATLYNVRTCFGCVVDSAAVLKALGGTRPARKARK